MSNYYNQPDNNGCGRRRKRGGSPFGTGLIFVVIGAFFLLKSFALPIPAWIISWQTLLIVTGAIVLIKSEFKNIGGIIMMGVGGIFLAREFFGWPWDMSKVTWPVIMIVVGLALMLRPKEQKRKIPPVLEGDDTMYKDPFTTPPTGEDYLNTSVIFSGESKTVVSKDFKGGVISAVFGGVDINLLQADINGEATINVDCVFGGIDLIVPANWNVRVLVHKVFAGVEDKRPVEMMTNTPGKVLIITGTCTFGGIEIKSYTA